RRAGDVVASLNRQAGGPDPRGYAVEWYLIAIAILPLGIMILTGFGAIPGAIAGGLVAGCLMIAQQERLPVAARVGISLGVTVLGYLVTILLIVLLFRAQRGW